MIRVWNFFIRIIYINVIVIYNKILVFGNHIFNTKIVLKYKIEGVFYSVGNFWCVDNYQPCFFKRLVFLRNDVSAIPHTLTPIRRSLRFTTVLHRKR